MASNGLLDSCLAAWVVQQEWGDVLDVVSGIYPFTHESGITGTFVPGKFGGIAKSFATDQANRLSYANATPKVFNPGDNDFTAMAWVKAHRALNNPYLAVWDSSGGTEACWLLWNRSTNLSHRLSISSDGTSEETIVEIANPDTDGTGAWQLVIGGYDSVADVIWLSVDGSTKTTVAHTGGAFASAAANLTMGWFHGSGGRVMGQQEQSESAYWTRNLSQADINAIYAGGSGLPIHQWDATVPVEDGSNIKDGLVSYFDFIDSSGGDRVDSHGPNDQSEVGAGAPIDQGITRMIGVFKSANDVYFSSNPGSLEYLEKSSPVDMGGGAGSWTIAGWARWIPGTGHAQAFFSRWLATGNQRGWTAFVNSIGGKIGLSVSSDGTGPGVTQCLNNETYPTTIGSYQIRFIAAWYDGDANELGIQVSGQPVVTVAGPATIHDTTAALQSGFIDDGSNLTLDDGDLFGWGRWNRVLSQLERTYLFRRNAGRLYSDFPEIGAGSGEDAGLSFPFQYYYR